MYLFQPDATSEEKRIKHQKELAEKLNEEARERLRGLQTSGDNKKYALCCFNKNVENKMVTVEGQPRSG